MSMMSNFPACCMSRSCEALSTRGSFGISIVSAAENMPGVARVITAGDVPGSKTYGPPDQPVFAFKDIRFKGERIAAVAAVDEDTAQEALEKIKLDIEEQTPVFDPFEAMKPDAPQVRPDGNIWAFNSGTSARSERGMWSRALPKRMK